MTLLKLVPVNRIKYLMKIQDISIDDLTFRLHYRFTFTFLLIGSLLLNGEQFFGKPIQCINFNKDTSTVPTKVIESYCWIEGTFTLPKGLLKVIGYEIAAPGVEQYRHFVEEAKKEKDEVIEHSYYQWVGIILFIQAVFFYATHLLWKNWEKGKMSSIINDLNKKILKETTKTKNTSNLATYLYSNRGKNTKYAMRYFACEVMNLVNVVCHMLFINSLLNGEFSTYGFDVLKFLDSDPSERIDPMAKVFPKVTKCTFRRFGPSGDLNQSDHLCVLPLNILNEKLFVVIWFWLYTVLIFSAVKVINRLLLISFPPLQTMLLSKFHRLAEPKDIDKIMDYSSYGDWFVIHLLSKNLDPMHFRDVMRELAKKFQSFEDGGGAGDYEKSDETHV